MSRSYRKNPVIKDGRFNRDNGKHGKKFANRKVRRSKDTFQHKDYKKLYCSWEINDYEFRMSKEELMSYFDSYNEDVPFYHSWMDEFKTLEDALNWWRKTYLRK